MYLYIYILYVYIYIHIFIYLLRGKTSRNARLLILSALSTSGVVCSEWFVHGMQPQPRAARIHTKERRRLALHSLRAPRQMAPWGRAKNTGVSTWFGTLKTQKNNACLPGWIKLEDYLLWSQEKLMSISSLIPKEPTHLPLSSHCTLSSLGKTPNVRCHLLIHNSNLAGVSTHVGAWQNWTIQFLRPNILVSIYVFHVFVKPKRIMVCWYDQPM